MLFIRNNCVACVRWAPCFRSTNSYQIRQLAFVFARRIAHSAHNDKQSRGQGRRLRAGRASSRTQSGTDSLMLILMLILMLGFLAHQQSTPKLRTALSMRFSLCCFCSVYMQQKLKKGLGLGGVCCCTKAGYSLLSGNTKFDAKQ